jgi:glycosyltransferase involved in cell wall biosynthesis
MKTLIEASSAYNVGAGIGRYARNVLEQFVLHAPDDGWTLVRARQAPGEPVFWRTPEGDKVREVLLPFSRRNADRVWHRLRLPLDLRLLAGRGDVLYSPEFMAPPTVGMPRMITVHDLAFMTHPEYTTRALKSFLSDVVPRQVSNAQLVAVVSEAGKRDLIENLDVPEEKIVVARNGVDDRFFAATPLDADRRMALGVPERYFLMVGTIEPRKNHLNTLRAFEMSGVGIDMPLLLAGRPGWAYESALEKANKLASRHIVKMLDFVPDDDLPGLYAGAQAVLYPSITEGFGIPIIESLATGTAVLTGTAAALREVGGDQASYTDPLDVEELSAKIRDLADRTTSGPYIRETRQGWARQFSWPDTGRVLLESLRRLGDG